MTRDYYNPQYGTLDVIVYVVLNHMFEYPHRIAETELATLDSVCARNARKFLSLFPPATHRVRAVRAIRNVCGLTVKDALYAYKQIIESYGE